MGAANSANYNPRQIQVMPRGSQNGMSDKLVLYHNGSLKSAHKPKPKPRLTEEYPKVIKLVQSSEDDENVNIEPTPKKQNFLHANYVSQSSYPQMRYPKIVHFEPHPLHRQSNYAPWDYGLREPRSDYMYKSSSFDGQRISLANIPVSHRLSNNSYYYNAPMPTNDERVIRRHFYDDSAFIMNRGSNNTYRSFLDPSDAVSSETQSICSQRSAASSRRSVDSASAVLLDRELEVHMVEKFQDRTGATYKVVRPIGERSHIVYTKPDVSNFLIIDNAPNVPPPSSPPKPETEKKAEEVVLDEEKSEKPEIESEVSNPSSTTTTATQTRRQKQVTYRDNKTFKLRQEIASKV